MARHPYSTNSDERKMVPFFLAILAVLTALALTSLCHWLAWEPPLVVDAPGTMTLYGIYYGLFKKFCWKWEWLRKVGILSTPIIEGTWEGKLQTSYAEGAPVHDVKVEIGQDWTDILIRLHTHYSRSRSLSGSMVVNEDETVLIYEYINEPKAVAVESLQMHYGTARLMLLDNSRLEGEYYTGRGRMNRGGITLHRKLTG